MWEWTGHTYSIHTCTHAHTLTHWPSVLFLTVIPSLILPIPKETCWLPPPGCASSSPSTPTTRVTRWWARRSRTTCCVRWTRWPLERSSALSWQGSCSQGHSLSLCSTQLNQWSWGRGNKTRPLVQPIEEYVCMKNQQSAWPIYIFSSPEIVTNYMKPSIYLTLSHVSNLYSTYMPTSTMRPKYSYSYSAIIIYSTSVLVHTQTYYSNDTGMHNNVYKTEEINLK